MTELCPYIMSEYAPDGENFVDAACRKTGTSIKKVGSTAGYTSCVGCPVASMGLTDGNCNVLVSRERFIQVTGDKNL